MIFDTKHGGLTGLKQKCIKMSEANARKVSVDVACLKWVEAPLEFFFFFLVLFNKSWSHLLVVQAAQDHDSNLSVSSNTCILVSIWGSNNKIIWTSEWAWFFKIWVLFVNPLHGIMSTSLRCAMCMVIIFEYQLCGLPQYSASLFTPESSTVANKEVPVV